MKCAASLVRAFAFATLSFSIAPAHAILKVYTVLRESFYVYRSPESGQARELTFSSMPPNVPGPSAKLLAVEGRAFHETLLLASSLKTAKIAAEKNINDAWQYYVNQKPQYVNEIKDLTLKVDNFKMKFSSLKQTVGDMDLTETQRKQLEREIESTAQSLEYYEDDLLSVTQRKVHTVQAEDRYVTAFTKRLQTFRDDIEKAYDDTKVYVIFATGDAYDPSLGLGLEEISTKGYCTKDPSGTDSCDFGAPPAETNAWEKLPGFPNLDLNINRQGETRT